MPKKSTSFDIYQLKITLEGVQPPVWRRIQVKSNVTFAQLHMNIQNAMGWRCSHLHQFTVKDICYSDPKFELMYDNEDQQRARLDRLVGLGDHFLYEYDFGDGWEHSLVVEAIVPPEVETKYPRCLAGARACPPEDCGGAWGYQNLIEVIGDPEHDEHHSMSEWVGSRFAPEEFSAKKTTALMS